MEEAVEIARAAVANGIREAVLTPHVHPGLFDNTLSMLKPRFQVFRQRLGSEGVELKVHLGGEVRLAAESLEMLGTGELPTLGAWDGVLVVLIEMPHDHIPAGTLNAMYSLRRRGIYPMLAHPERNKDVMRDWRRLKPLLADGLCLAQITAGSVCGGFGVAANRTARQLLDNGWVTAVATDAHNLLHRPPVLRQALQELTQHYGRSAAELLIEGNPACPATIR
jgi:protein-tyrosine phosphatase